MSRSGAKTAEAGPPTGGPVLGTETRSFPARCTPSACGLRLDIAALASLATHDKRCACLSAPLRSAPVLRIDCCKGPECSAATAIAVLSIRSASKQPLPSGTPA